MSGDAAGETEHGQLDLNKDFDAVAREFHAKLRDVKVNDDQRRAPPRADQLDTLERTEVVWRRLELAKVRGLKGVSREAGRILGSLTTSRLATPTYGDLLDVVVMFRNLSAWDELIDFVAEASFWYFQDGIPFARLRPIAQQYGMALGRRRRWDEAEQLLTAVVADYGPDAETLGILGRVYKARWLHSRGQPEANYYLIRSINAYASGLLANPGELYPAINLMTLFRVAGVTGVAFDAVETHVWPLIEKRQRGGLGDYFDYATAVEFHALFSRRYDADLMLDEALQRVRSPWELKTTAANLRILWEGSNRGRAWRFLNALHRRLTREAVPTPASERKPLVR
jgi:hypothetical protein